jgi:hypothetical protein
MDVSSCGVMQTTSDYILPYVAASEKPGCPELGVVMSGQPLTFVEALSGLSTKCHLKRRPKCWQLSAFRDYHWTKRTALHFHLLIYILHLCLLAALFQKIWFEFSCRLQHYIFPSRGSLRDLLTLCLPTSLLSVRLLDSDGIRDGFRWI